MEGHLDLLCTDDMVASPDFPFCHVKLFFFSVSSSFSLTLSHHSPFPSFTSRNSRTRRMHRRKRTISAGYNR